MGKTVTTISLTHSPIDILIALAKYNFLPALRLNDFIHFNNLVRVRFTALESIQIVHQGAVRTPLQTAFLKDDIDSVMFMVLNKFILDADVSAMFSDSEFRNHVQKKSPKTQSLLNRMTSQPWSLQELSMAQISSNIKPFLANDERNKAVESLPLPTILKLKLKFNHILARLCPLSWNYIQPYVSEVDVPYDENTRHRLLNSTTLCRNSCCERVECHILMDKRFVDLGLDLHFRQLYDEDGFYAPTYGPDSDDDVEAVMLSFDRDSNMNMDAYL